ncbi:retrovirus-related Pol polyprotein from transposon 297 [Trichonephila clavipes]|uniref:Retrovirus-related Pol polyprotein from transposon 297 n=1 Tax=Trichonephila clavipes TaxID=2585209 RepID=A0A8X6W465_TRICX|nr:retrovirus-related Pol polyprotein from transposon 297 [Trichonephila clavipes]
MTHADLPYVPILLNETFITALWDTGAEKSFVSEEVYRRYFSYRPRQKTKDRVLTTQGAVLSLRTDQPGLTHILYHEIDTGDQGPVVSRPYRYDRVKERIIDYHIEKMLQEGTIRPIQSPYVSPVVLTCKNNGLPPDSPEAYRFAIDYHKLNAINKYPRYPLPLIDDLIKNIPHTAMMSTLDLKSDYFQLAVNPRDIEKTAFITRNGTFAFLRMPFGLSGAAPNFQKAIDIILKPVLGRLISCYMDDVIIMSPSFNEHRSFESGIYIVARRRNPVDYVERSQISCAALRALALNSREKLIQEHWEDPELGHIYRYLQNPDEGSVNAAVCEAPISLISDNGPQFISDVFEHLSHRLDIKHTKTVTYRPQANLTERVNRNLVQMIACFVEENHDNWGRFLHEFFFTLCTTVNESTGKIPAELCLGKMIITPFRKLVRVTEGAEYVGGNIVKLFDEARQNMWKQHKTWEKYYNRKRRGVNIKSVGSSSEQQFDHLKRGRRVTVNIEQVRIYHPRQSDTNSFDSINETLYEGKGSSNWSYRWNSGKSRRSRKPSGNESKSCKSNKGTAGLEDLRFKRSRAVVSTGTAERYDRKRHKICRKRSLQGSEYKANKRKAPALPQGLKRGVPSSISSRTHKNIRRITNNHPSQGPETLPGARRTTRGAKEYWDRQSTTEQPQEKEPQHGSLRRRSGR